MKSGNANLKIRVALMETKMNQWELARMMNMHEASLSRKLRDELPEEEQDRIVNLIRQNTQDGDQDDR